MSEDPLVAELRAAPASLVTATAAAEVHDWAAVEQGAMDAKHRLEGMMKDIAIKLRWPIRATSFPRRKTNEAIDTCSVTRTKASKP